jgi:hypothetical protein
VLDKVAVGTTEERVTLDEPGASEEVPELEVVEIPAEVIVELGAKEDVVTRVLDSKEELLIDDVATPVEDVATPVVDVATLVDDVPILVDEVAALVEDVATLVDEVTIMVVVELGPST